MVSASRLLAMSRNTPPCGEPRPSLTSAFMARATSSRGRRSGVRLAFFLSGIPAIGLLFGIGGLTAEHLGYVPEHEPFALRISEDSAVSPHAFGHEDAPYRNGPHHARWMELDELHVDEIGAGSEGKSVTIAGVLPGVGGHLVRLPYPAGSKDDGGSLERDESTGLSPVAKAPVIPPPFWRSWMIVHSMNTSMSSATA